MMCMMASSANSRGFSSQLQSGRLPQIDHITYQGVFNQLDFQVGPKTNKTVDLHIGFSRSGYSQSSIDNTVNEYLAIFMKGKSDGQPRDHRILNAVIVLDISGSMGEKLSQKGIQDRLSLSKKAIIMFLEKLRPNDSFGLVVFDTQAITLIPSTLKKDLEMEVVKTIVNKIVTKGGTTLNCGFSEGVRNLKQFLKEYSKKQENEKRLIMLTDVGDNSLPGEKNFIQSISKEEEIHVTIVGISQDFNSSICQKLNQIKGFNYFCAVEDKDISKYLVSNFDFTFFPAAYDIQLSIQSEQMKYFEVFGTADQDKVNQYNNFTKKGNNKFIITKTKTTFPSQLSLKNGIIHQFGGLILLKFKAGAKVQNFEGRIQLTYKNLKREDQKNQYPLKFNFPSEQQFYSEKCLEQAIQGFYFVYEIKNILIKMKNKETKLSKQNKKEYLKSLKNLENIVPTDKKKDLQGMINVVQKHGQKNSFGFE